MSVKHLACKEVNGKKKRNLRIDELMRATGNAFPCSHMENFGLRRNPQAAVAYSHDMYSHDHNYIMAPKYILTS